LKGDGRVPQPFYPRFSAFQRPRHDNQPADFVKTVDNPYFTLQPGTTFIYENADSSAANEFVVTRRTKVIQGVTCVVVMDTATEDGEVVEKTFDYFAQDIYGNVWYFGEDTKEFVDGKVVSTEGTWRAGVDGAQPGIIMEASPQIGDEYNQENAPGVAEDRAEVLSLGAPASAPYAAFLQTIKHWIPRRWPVRWSTSSAQNCRPGSDGKCHHRRNRTAGEDQDRRHVEERYPRQQSGDGRAHWPCRQ
jgi:hypothetical protein